MRFACAGIRNDLRCDMRKKMDAIPPNVIYLNTAETAKYACPTLITVRRGEIIRSGGSITKLSTLIISQVMTGLVVYRIDL
jgi:hypothetical protein